MLDGTDVPASLTVVGGNAPAALFAAVLAERGAAVTLASTHENFGVGLAPPRLWRTMHALRSFGVTLAPSTDPADLDLDGPTTFAFEPWSAAPEPFLPPRGVEWHRVGDCNDSPLLDGAIARRGRSRSRVSCERDP